MDGYVQKTDRQKVAIEKVLKEGKSVSKAMREAGYSKGTSKNPKNLTNSRAWNELLEKYLPDKDLADAHKQLLKATDLGHMVFPAATKDEEIKKLLASVNCTAKKIQRGEQAKHVWFWMSDNKARKDALDMSYKLKGHYKPEKKEITGNLSLTDLFNQAADGNE